MATNIILIVCIAIFCCSIVAEGAQIGVNYGMLGTGLPPAGQVVTLMKSNNIGKMKIFQADRDALKAFANSGIEVIVGVGNNELQLISSSQDAANGWVNDNIRPFYPATNIKYIAVGNEVLTGTNYGSYLVPAMRNIQTALQNANLQNNIKVSTTHSSDVSQGYPPHNGVFKDQFKDTMKSVLQFLLDHGSPFMGNIYPHISYINNRAQITLDYALFKSTSTVVTDNGRSYKYLFDALVDTLISAMEALGYPNIPLIVTESGWPSAGVDVATVDNARTYNNNLIRHVLSNEGTPKRPGTSIETYIFALFNEDKKPAGMEQHFGLFYPNQQHVYPVNFSP